MAAFERGMRAAYRNPNRLKRAATNIIAPNKRPFSLTSIMALTPQAVTESSTSTTDYSNWNNSSLIQRITELERQLNQYSGEYKSERTPDNRSVKGNNNNDNGQQTASSSSLSNFTNQSESTSSSASPSRRRFREQKKIRNIDPSKYNTRFIAIKFAYLGKRYNGYEHANGNTTPLPTIEEELYKALRKTRLIFPKNAEDVENFNEKDRQNTPFEIDWDGCEYSKCGRTDRGVSAFGQVMGIRVRSKRPKSIVENRNGAVKSPGSSPRQSTGDDPMESDMGGLESSNLVDSRKSNWDDISDELPYLQILNSVLPEDIRALAWCPNPPPGFNARHSCLERRYRYFFTQPAFTPTPGPLGFLSTRNDTKDSPGSKIREGWLDIAAMQEGAEHYVGLHDFRNLCKLDTSKQLDNFMRRISYAAIEVVDPNKVPLGFVGESDLGQFEGDTTTSTPGKHLASADKIYSFTVHGSAFLWHQIRHMVAILFLIGQGLESPSVVPELLDTAKHPGRPTYEMASEAPLVLWDCVYPDQSNSDDVNNRLEWVYGGDSRILNARSGRGDGKYGQGGIVDGVWKVWRKHKMDEILAGTLLDLVVNQGDQNARARGGFRQPNQDQLHRNQKAYFGGNEAKSAGKHIPLMKRHKLDPVEVQNAKYISKEKNYNKYNGQLDKARELKSIASTY